MPLLTCPNDGAGMQEVNRNGVLIDVCPQCRGVWLDRGELEKLLSYMQSDEQGEYRSEDRRNEYKSDEYRRERYDDDDDYKHRGKKKRSLFDFFD